MENWRGGRRDGGGRQQSERETEERERERRSESAWGKAEGRGVVAERTRAEKLS
jgi:hypothetical protein